MKVLKTIAVCVLLSVCYYEGSAQSIPINEPDYNKPKLFNDLPNKMTLRIADVDASLNQSVGSNITVQIANGLVIHGTVVSKSNEADANVKSVVIKSSNRQGAACTLTKVFNSDGTVTYRGRIISMRHGDAFEVVLENGTYVLNKTTLYDLYNE
jgi:hypothetical protein